MSHVLPEPKHIAPPEFGEGLAQFLVERTYVGTAHEYMPIVVWVDRRPIAASGSDCPKCPVVYRVTRDSESFVNSKTGGLLDRARKRRGYSEEIPLYVCPCMGRFVE